MFNIMGMNFFNIAILKRSQFNDGRIKNFRKKTHYEGDYFSVLQNDEFFEIIYNYLNAQKIMIFCFHKYHKTLRLNACIGPITLK